MSETKRKTLIYSYYRDMLAKYRDAGYRYLSFPEALRDPSQQPSFVLIRHDIDFDLVAARKMAEIDFEMGIQSTFFFMVRTMHYNIFSAEGSAEIEKILQMGHHLGLHFDCAAYPDSFTVDELGAHCTREADMMEQWFDKPVEIVSFHRPSPIVMSGDPALSGHRPHTYQKVFTEKMHYYSDSRGEWRHNYPSELDTFTTRGSMHLLIHPIWWHEEAKLPLESMNDYIARSKTELRASAARNCTVCLDESWT